MRERVGQFGHEVCNTMVPDFILYPYGKNHSSSVIVSEINLIFLPFEDSVSKSKHKFYFNVEMLKEFSFIYEI